MGLWVLADRHMEFVPGTTRYFDDLERPQVAAAQQHIGLKCDTYGKLPIILIPQPSDDPNDPLNWPLWKRDIITAVLSLTSVFATSLGPILAANTLTLSFYFEIIFTETALLTGYFLLGVGVAGIFLVPTARVWGKRHQFLLGTVILIVTSIWGGFVGEPVTGTGQRYTSLLWARIFQGVGTAPFEALINAAIGDLYFVHERGKRMALTNLAVFGGAFFTPILVGKITHTIGWPWSFYFVSIFCAVCLPLLFFFCPETAYLRSAYLNTDLVSSDDFRSQENIGGSHELQSNAGASISVSLDGAEYINGHANKKPGTAPWHPAAQDTGANIPKQSWAQSLRIFNGRKSNESYWKLLLRPFSLFAHPAILWACLIQGTMIGWTVFIGVVLGAIFLGPPLFWDEVNTGYAYTGAFVGSVMGFLLAGGLADWSAKFMTRKNGGIYEPEFRIILVIPQMIFGVTGLFGFGITASRLVDFHWSVPIAFFGMQVGAMVIGAVAASLYIVDAHRDIAVEAFTCILIFKNFFSFGLTFKAYDWIVKKGIYTTFMAISSVQIVICLLSIPMYIFGKRNRSFFHRHDILKICGLR
ncbi:MFS transporter-like protein [Calycina marina]|uniref:MFS transporter-like protein n=1 Tax=Calycina marina TaxID=1763456 RepID=A0A9P8CD50_9HELO|nr:MFS transporter-like protein [Calycina marina]